MYITMVKYLDKNGNIAEFSGTTLEEDRLKNRLNFIGGVYFEPKELLVITKEEKVAVKESKTETVSDLDFYKSKLKDAKVKGRQLISDAKRAKSKCEELWLL